MLASDKHLAEGSDEASEATDTGDLQDRQQCWVVAARDTIVEVHPCVSQCGALAILCCVGSLETIIFLLFLLQIEITTKKKKL